MDENNKPTLKFCIKCGAPITDKDIFCMICGYKIERDIMNNAKPQEKKEEVVQIKEKKKETSLKEKVKEQKEKVVAGTKKVVEDVKKETDKVVAETKKTIDETKKRINEEKTKEDKKEIVEAKIEKEEIKEDKPQEKKEEPKKEFIEEEQPKVSPSQKKKEDDENTKIAIIFCVGIFSLLSFVVTLRMKGLTGVFIPVFTAIGIYAYSFCIDNEIIKNKYNIKKGFLTLCFSIAIFTSILCMFIVFISSISKKQNNTYNNIPQQEEKKEQKEEENEEKKEEIFEKEEHREEPPIEKEEETNSQEEEQKEEETADNKIVMEDRSTDFTGKNYKDVEQEMKSLGFTSVTSNGKETTNEKAVNENVFEITINNKSFYEGDKFIPTDEVKINYWIVKQEEAKVEYVPPKQGSKIAKDYDSETSNDKTKYYFNVDGVKNVPKVQKYENAYITDGVYEYINYLKGLGFKVEITKVNNREPYKGFHSYETYFKVSKGSTSWTMYLSIDDEKYVEYGLEIYLVED